MKNWILLLALLITTVGSASAQNTPIDTAGFQTFTYQEGDQTYLMKQYFLCFLKAGPNRDQDAAAEKELQAAHLAYLGKLAADRKICLAGPTGDDADLRGILVMSVPTLAEAQALANADPAVQAGRLIVEIHPWWAAVGSELF